MAPNISPSGTIQQIRSRINDAQDDEITNAVLNKVKETNSEREATRDAKRKDQKRIDELQASTTRLREKLGIRADEIEVMRRKKAEKENHQLRTERDEAIEEATSCHNPLHLAAIDRLKSLEPALPFLQAEASEAAQLRLQIIAQDRELAAVKRKARNWTSLVAGPEESSMKIKCQRDDAALFTLIIIVGDGTAKIVWEGMAVLWVGNCSGLWFVTDVVSFNFDICLEYITAAKQCQRWKIVDPDENELLQWISEHRLWQGMASRSSLGAAGSGGDEDHGDEVGSGPWDRNQGEDRDEEGEGEGGDVDEDEDGRSGEESEEPIGAFSIPERELG